MQIFYDTHEKFIIDEYVDNRMLPYIHKFHDKGLLPIFSCEGHPETENILHAYIMFSFIRDKKKAIEFKRFIQNMFPEVDVAYSMFDEYSRVDICSKQNENNKIKYMGMETKLKRQKEFFDVLDKLLECNLERFRVKHGTTI